MTSNEIGSIDDAWSDSHKLGYMVETYDFNGTSITYIPSKELSWGTSKPQIDFNIFLE